MPHHQVRPSTACSAGHSPSDVFYPSIAQNPLSGSSRPLSPGTQYQVVVKGSPNVLKGLLLIRLSEIVPPDDFGRSEDRLNGTLAHPTENYRANGSPPPSAVRGHCK